MLIDLHIHTDISACSRLSLEDILANARSTGVDGVCLTDHDSMEVLAQIEEGFQSDGLLVIVGMEYTTPQGDFLAYGVTPELEPGMDATDLMQAVADMGGAVVAAHPYRGWRPSDVSVIIPGVCAAVETENGRNTGYENILAAKFAMERGLPTVGGSDAHALEELGRCPTRFNVPVANSRDLVDALNRGLCEPAFVRTPLAVAS